MGRVGRPRLTQWRRKPGRNYRASALAQRVVVGLVVARIFLPVPGGLIVRVHLPVLNIGLERGQGFYRGVETLALAADREPSFRSNL